MCKVSTVFENLFKSLQAGIYNDSHLIKNLARVPKKTRFFNEGFSCILVFKSLHEVAPLCRVDQKNCPAFERLLITELMFCNT